MVGKLAITMGIIRSFLLSLAIITLLKTSDLTLTFLSEYQPQKSVMAAETTPPGVDKISVCLVLGSIH